MDSEALKRSAEKIFSDDRGASDELSSVPENGASLQNDPARFLNRELSWLAFNRRVMEEARNTRHPAMERLRFLSIAASNQEEFFMVRVANIRAQVRAGIIKISPDGLTPAQQLALIKEQTVVFARDLQETWRDMRGVLKESGIDIVPPSELSDEEKVWTELLFSREIFPVLTPIAVDPSHPFPFISNRGTALALKFHNRKTKQDMEALIILPASLQRFVRLPGLRQRHILLEDLVLLYIEHLFPDPMQLKDAASFRLLRDTELEIEEEAEDLLRTYEVALKRRRRGNVIRLTVNNSVTSDLLNFLVDQLEIESRDVLFFGDLIGMADLRELVTAERPDLLFPPFQARFPERIREFDGNCFAAIKHKDIVVHHPYESFDVVVQFLRQAARDPDVLSIKQTIYRTSRKSPIVEALIEAAEAGKSVTALVEIKARFDEEANLRWARDMEKAGVQVVFGFLKLKTHAKVSLVTRREAKHINSYVHFGTGNYHPDTAKVYTDLSFFTCDQALCRDAALLFNYMTGYAEPKKLTKLAVSPMNMRQTILQLVATETENAKAGKPATIWAKCNSLADPDIIDALYKASQAGVEIELIVRGICMLRPGIEGLSENIRVKSIVGRFLEHARIYCFGAGHGLPSAQAKVFISSADLMPRNLDSRIETLIPISNPTIHRQVIEQIMVANLKDRAQSWIMQKDGSYARVSQEDGAFSAHDYFLKNPSLSGRGKSL